MFEGRCAGETVLLWLLSQSVNIPSLQGSEKYSYFILSFQRNFGLLFNVSLVEWEVFTSADAIDVISCLPANL